MVALVAGRKAVEDLHRLRGGRLFHLHPAKAAFQRGVLLDMGAELLIGGGADELQFAPGKHRFQDAGGVDGALGGTGTHDGVELVDKQDGGAVPHQLFQQVFQPLFKIAPVFGARHQTGHIQRQQPPPLQRPGHLPGGNAQRQTFGQRRFAHARLADQTGVVFLAAAQDLHHAVKLGFPAKHRVQLSFGGAAGQIAAVFIAGAAAPGDAGRHPGLGGQHKLSAQLAALPHRLGERKPHLRQQQPGGAAVIFQHGAEQMLRLCPADVGVLRPNERIVHGAAQVRCHGLPVQPLCRAAALLRQLAAHLRLGNVFPGEELRRSALLLQHCQQKMAGIRLFTAQISRQLHRLLQQPRRRARKAPVTAHAQIFPNAHVSAPCCI